MVQTLVDFSRPVDLQVREQDLRQVVGDVLALATRGIVDAQHSSGGFNYRLTRRSRTL